MNEFKRWCPSLKTVCLIGSAEQRVIKAIACMRSKDVNGYSNIRIHSEYSNTISEFEYSHLFSVPAFLSFFYFFVFFFIVFKRKTIDSS